MNPDSVVEARANGKTVVYGDATSSAVLIEEGIKIAKFLVVTIPDPVASRRIIALGRELNPEIYIITRTRFYNDLEELLQIGANEVIPEEFESAIETVQRLLKRNGTDTKVIEDIISSAQSKTYRLLHGNATQRS